MKRKSSLWAGLFLFSGYLVFSPISLRADITEASTTPVRVGVIMINRSNVFDLSQELYNRIPYTWANKFHIVTREEFIREELLFKTGDPYDEELIKESERVLRSRPIFRYVTITSQPPVNGQSNIMIRTDDVWTTAVQVGYGTAGGENFYRLGILEHNFLGYGNTAGAFVKQDIDRFVKGVTYKDPHFFGNLWEGFAGYGQDEKGKDLELVLEKPYKSFITENSAGGSFRLTNDEDRLFENGDEVANFQHDKVASRVFASMALDPNKEEAHRVGLAYETREDEFSDFDFKIPLAPPTDRTVNAVLITFNYKDNQYKKKRGVRTFDRDEDFNFGWDTVVEAGPSLRSLGSTEDGVVSRLRIQRTWGFSHRQLVFSNFEIDGRAEKNRLEDTVLRLKGEYVLQDGWSNNILSVRGELTQGLHLPADKQFLLGGENGLRGYSVRQFSGAKKALVTLENRRVLLYDWLNLANLGWAVFADTGGVWDEDQKMAFNELHSDAGIGFRFAPSRSYHASLIRADLVYAFDDNNRRSRWVINIGGAFEFGEVEQRKFDQ